MTTESAGLSSIEQLRSILGSDKTLTDLATRLCFAHDASSYRLVPQAVVRPTDIDDIKTLMWWARSNKVSITFRAAGTSLSGQAVTDGVIADISGRGNWDWAVIEENARRIRVGPGLIGGMANALLRQYNRKLGPDPASINSCCIGGIIANNSSGMCCGIRHNSYHTISSLTYLLANGAAVNTALPDADARLRLEAPILYGVLSRLRYEILHNPTLSDKIRDKYLLKNTVGYSLNALLDYSSPAEIMGRLIIGSEGTLGFIAEAVFDTIPDKQYKLTGLLYFSNVSAACRAIEPLKISGAEALELMDRAALRSVENSAIAPPELRQLPEGAAALLVEYQDEDLYGSERSKDEAARISAKLPLLYPPVFTSSPTKHANLWKLRKGMFPSVGAKRQAGTGIINEDVAFPVERLAEAVEDLHLLFTHMGYTDAIVFGHAKDGNLHFVLTQPFDSEADIQRYASMMDALANLVIEKYGGSLKAEHGTGRNIAPYVEQEWGEELYAMMKEIKQASDPDNILNRGVLINDDSDCHVKNIKAFPTVHPLIDQCIECGYCERLCPSAEFTLTPRQRIVLLREAKLLEQSSSLESQQAAKTLLQDFQYLGVASCASDGMCSLSCPVNIDTGTLMKQFRAEKRKNVEKFAAETVRFVFPAAEVLTKAGLRFAHGLSRRLGAKFVQSKLAPIRSMLPILPQWNPHLPYPPKRFSTHKYNSLSKISQPIAALFPTCLTRTMGSPEVNETSLTEILKILSARAGVGLQLLPSSGLCCGMSFTSKGFETSGQRSAASVAAMIRQQVSDTTVPIVLDASSCAATAKESLKNEFAVLDIVEFLYEYIMPRLTVQQKLNKVVLHPTCANEKMQNTEKLRVLAECCAKEVIIPHSWKCCGFAGDKGLHIPELTISATRHEAREAMESEADGCYSANTMCETAMTSATGLRYRSIAYLVEKATRESTNLRN